MMNEPLSSIMTRQVITAGPDDLLSVARDILEKQSTPPAYRSRYPLDRYLTTYDIFK